MSNKNSQMVTITFVPTQYNESRTWEHGERKISHLGFNITNYNIKGRPKVAKILEIFQSWNPTE